MNNFTFLTVEQCFGDEKLDIFKKRGIKAALTDFPILLGAFVIKNDSSLGRISYYWTKSNNKDKQVRVVTGNDILYDDYDVDLRNIGARPAYVFSSIGSIPTNGESGKRAKDGILEVEYGYYPQKAVSRDMQEILESAYLSRKHIKNGK